MHGIRTAGMLLVALALMSAGSSASDWPWFLGPTHDGLSPETGLLKSWTKQRPRLVWERDVGTGYSAPSIRGDRLVIHHRIGREEIVECIDALTSEVRWTHSSPSNFRDPYGYNNGPRCSPLLTQTHCYTLGAEGKFVCLELDDGELVWERDLLSELSVPEAFFGVGASPLLEDGKLIVLVGGQPNSGVVAFDPLTGKTLWEAVGQKTWDGVEDESGRPYKWTGEEMIVSYASPVAATIHGKRHLLCLMRQGLVSLDPQTGKERFRYWFRSRVHESVNGAQPVVAGDTILLSAAYQVGSALLKVAPSGNDFEVVWRNRRNLLAHWSTPVYHEGYFYGFSGRHENEGRLTCIAATDGEVQWASDGWEQPLDPLKQDRQTRAIIDTRTGEEIPWPFYGRGSKILVEDQFIVLGERGTLALVNVDPAKWDEVSRMLVPRMRYPSWTAPVLANGHLYLRCEDALVCLDLRAASAGSE